MASNQERGDGVTVGAVTTTVVSLPLQRNLVAHVHVVVVARDSLDAGSVFELSAAIRSGPVVAIPLGVVAIPFTRADPTMVLAAATLVVTPVAVEVRVTGVVGRRIQWAAEIESLVVG